MEAKLRQVCLLAVGVLSQQASPQVLPEAAVSRGVDQQVGGKDNRQDGSRQVGRQTGGTAADRWDGSRQENAELQVSSPSSTFAQEDPAIRVLENTPRTFQTCLTTQSFKELHQKHT